MTTITYTEGNFKISVRYPKRFYGDGKFLIEQLVRMIRVLEAGYQNKSDEPTVVCRLAVGQVSP